MRIVIVLFLIVLLSNVQYSFSCDFDNNKEVGNYSGKPHMSAYQRRQLKKLKNKKNKEQAKYTFKEVSNFRIDKCSLYSIAWSRDISKLFCLVETDSKKYTLMVIDPFSRKLRFRRSNCFCGASKIELSPDERKISLGTTGRIGYEDLLIYDLSSKQLLEGFENFAHKHYRIKSTAWSPCSTKIAANFHGLVLIYDIKSKKTIHRFHFPNSIGEMNWSEDGNKLLFNLCDGENSVGLLDIETGDYNILYEHGIKEDNYTSTGPRVNQFVWLSENVFAACSNYKIVFWDIEKGQELKTFYTQMAKPNAPWYVNGIPASFASDDAALTYLSPNGKFLALLHPQSHGTHPKEFSIIDIENNKIVSKDLHIVGHEFWGSFLREFQCLQWSHDSKFLAASTKYGDIKIWGKILI